MVILYKLGVPTAFAILFHIIKESGIAGDFLKLNERIDYDEALTLRGIKAEIRRRNCSIIQRHGARSRTRRW